MGLSILNRNLFREFAKEIYTNSMVDLNFSFTQLVSEFDDFVHRSFYALTIYMSRNFLRYIPVMILVCMCIFFICNLMNGMRKIEAKYAVKKNWQGDPCVLVVYSLLFTCFSDHYNKKKKKKKKIQGNLRSPLK